MDPLTVVRRRLAVQRLSVDSLATPADVDHAVSDGEGHTRSELGAALVSATLFTEPDAAGLAAVEDEVARFGRFLGRSAEMVATRAETG